MAGASRGSTAIRAAFDDEIAFTRTDEQEERNICGSLRIEGRNVPKEVIHVAFDPDQARWTTVNEPEVVAEPQLRERILLALDEANAWLTAKDIAGRLPGTKLKTVQNKIAEMLQERPLPMALSGQPKKGSPRRFASLNRRLNFAPDNSGNDEGNNGNEDWRAA
jgi:hypothetical protein